MNNEAKYTIGHYKPYLVAGKYKYDLSSRIIYDQLQPMTHKQAITMISKQSKPAIWFVVPLN